MKIAVLQMTSGEDPEENLKKIDSLCDGLKAETLFLPECFLSLSDGKKAPKAIDGASIYFEKILNLAKKYQINLVGGSVPFLENGKVFNRVLNVSRDGKLINTYDKRKLFACDLPGVKLDEENLYNPGDKEQTVQIGDWKIGLSVCFDVRFPEIYQNYRSNDCNLMSISAAFTVPTGKAHWHTLVRARAIETQSYVVASCQWGQNHPKISTFGHSLVVDPWGAILLDLEQGEKVSTVELKLGEVNEVRKRILMKK